MQVTEHVPYFWQSKLLQLYSVALFYNSLVYNVCAPVVSLAGVALAVLVVQAGAKHLRIGHNIKDIQYNN